jgi:hypothetical protein
MKNRIVISTFFLFISLTSLLAQDKPPLTPSFSGETVIFSEYPGIAFRLSNPFLRYQPWDIERTGSADFAIAIELTNKTDKYISALTFSVTVYNTSGKAVYQASVGSGPFTFAPNAGTTLPPGYVGVYDAFITRDKGFFNDFGRVDFKIMELKTASASLTAQVVFDDQPITFKDFPGLEFYVSKPYAYLDSMSGDELFAIALKFVNSSKTRIQALYFDATIFDDKGQVDQQQDIQEHNQRMSPPVMNYGDPYFPDNYTGIDKAFFTRADLSLLKTIKRVEIKLIKVE